MRRKEHPENGYKVLRTVKLPVSENGSTPPGDGEAEEVRIKGLLEGARTALERVQIDEEDRIKKVTEIIEEAGQKPKMVTVPAVSWEDQINELAEIAKGDIKIGSRKISAPRVSEDARRILRRSGIDDKESVFILGMENPLSLLEDDPARKRRGLTPLAKRLESFLKNPIYKENGLTEMDPRAYLQVVINKIKQGMDPIDYTKGAVKTLITGTELLEKKKVLMVWWDPHNNRLELDVLHIDNVHDSARFRLCCLIS